MMMLLKIRLGFIAMLCLSFASLSAVHLEFALPSDRGCYLMSYYGSGVRLVDSLLVDDGVAHYTSGQDLPEGVYSIRDEQGHFFDFLVGNDQDFRAKIDFSAIASCQIEGARESELFLSFQQSMAQGKNGLDRYRDVDDFLVDVDRSSVLFLLLNALKPVQDDSGALLCLDQMAVYDAKVKRYWEAYDLGDARLLRTPFFAARIDEFLNKVLLPRHDKMLEGIMPLLQRAESNDEVLRLVASKVLDLAIKNQVMGIDALGYEVISRYYLNGRFGSFPKRQTAMLLDYVRYTANCRVGHVGKELVLSSFAGVEEEVSLYALESKYTLLLFWEPDCAYCEAVLPVLRDKILPRYEALGLRVFAVNTQGDVEPWRNYIFEHGLEDWVHGIQTSGARDFMVDYGVQGTPFLYILDHDKRILAKNVKLDFIDSMLSRLFATGNIY